MSAVTARFNATVRQMTEMSQWQKSQQKIYRNVETKENSCRVVHKLFNKTT